MAIQGIFGKIANAQANQKGDFIKKGSGRAVILECMQKSGNSGNNFIVRLKILASKGKDGSTPNAEGSQVSWIQSLDKFQSAFGNVKAFVLNVTGVKEAEVSAEEFVETLEDMINYVPGAKSESSGRSITATQAARGMLVDYDTYDQQTKTQKAAKSTETNTYAKFIHVTEQGDVAARRAELDKTDPLQN